VMRLDVITDVRYLDEPGYPVAALRNPVTRTWVSLSPPFAWQDLAEREGLLTRFAAWCMAGWNLARLDPQEIDARFGWNCEPDEAAFAERTAAR